MSSKCEPAALLEQPAAEGLSPGQVDTSEIALPFNFGKTVSTLTKSLMTAYRIDRFLSVEGVWS